MRGAGQLPRSYLAASMVVAIAPVKILGSAVVIGMEQFMDHSMIDLILAVQLIRADCHLPNHVQLHLQ